MVDDVGNGDRNCDGMVACYADADGDGFGVGIVAHPASGPTCSDQSLATSVGVSLDDGDCDDTRADVNPLELERCDPDNVDENCNRIADNAELGNPNVNVLGVQYWYVDDDGDGFGEIGPSARYCPDEAPGYSLLSTDCDDNNPDVHPEEDLANPVLIEVPTDLVDQNCDGLELCYPDNDSDGYGSATPALFPFTPGENCDDVLRAASVNTDCDDQAPLVFPFATEHVAQDGDEDCDGFELCYADADQDTFGDRGPPQFTPGEPDPYHATHGPEHRLHLPRCGLRRDRDGLRRRRRCHQSRRDRSPAAPQRRRELQRPDRAGRRCRRPVSARYRRRHLRRPRHRHRALRPER